MTRSKLFVAAFSAVVLASSARAQTLSDVLSQQLPRADLSPRDVSQLLQPSQHPANERSTPAQVSAIVPIDPRQGQFAAAVRRSVAAIASIKSHELGHGGVTSLLLGSLDGSFSSESVVPPSLRKGLFCHMLCGDNPCGEDDRARTCKATFSAARLELVAGLPNGPGPSHLFRSHDDGGSSSPAGYTFLGQMIDHDLTNTLAALADAQTSALVAQAVDPNASDIPLQAIDLGGERLPLPRLASLTVTSVPESVSRASGSSVQIDLENTYRVTSFDDLRESAQLFPWFELDDHHKPTGNFNLKLVRSGDLTAFDFFRRDDPARPHQRMALIGEGRNDENRMLAQIQSLFMLAHNQCMVATKRTKELGAAFDACHAWVRELFQAIVLTDFLPRIVDPGELKAMSGEGMVQPGQMTLPDAAKIDTPLYHCKVAKEGDSLRRSKMPLEFAAAAFRLGHSLLRNQYTLRAGVTKDLFDPTNNSVRADLLGGRDLEAGDVIDWSEFFDVSKSHPPQLANALDLHITTAVADMPKATLPNIPLLDKGQPVIGADNQPVLVADTPTIVNLPLRNVERSQNRMPGGAALVLGGDAADLARDLGHLLSIKRIPDADFMEVVPKEAMANGVPLWIYVLGEAQAAGGKHLGALGSHIVGEVLLGTSRCDSDSVIHKVEGLDSPWQPIRDLKARRRFSMPDLIEALQAGDHDVHLATP